MMPWARVGCSRLECRELRNRAVSDRPVSYPDKCAPIRAFTRFSFCNSSGLTATPSHQRRICERETV
jgi:hypothetical protein